NEHMKHHERFYIIAGNGAQTRVNSPPAAIWTAVLKTDSVGPLCRLLNQTGVFPRKAHEKDP
ncbi:MAG: hypothetical protein KJO60_00185, partial [Desulfofustis sp.]|nr:hypothetical protein [Desulfofustis sp.]